MYRVCLILMFNLISAVPDIYLIISNKEEAICVGTGDEVEKFGIALVTSFLNDTIEYKYNSIDERRLIGFYTHFFKEQKIKSFEKNIPPVLDKRWKYLETGSGNRIFFPFNKTNISVLHFSVRFKDTLTVVLHFEDISYCAFIYEPENVSQTFTKNCPSITKQTKIQDFHQWKHYTIFQKNNDFVIQPSHFSIKKVEVFSPSKIELISTNSMQYKIHSYDVLKIEKDDALAVFRNIKIHNHNCISIFLFIQSNCEIKFSLEDLDGEENTIYQTFSTNETYIWNEIKMFFKNETNFHYVTYKVHVSMYNIDNGNECNAVLDQNIYSCSDKYFDRVTIKKEIQDRAEVACQHFKNNNLVTYSQPNTNVVTSSVDSFGLYTNITCNNIFNTKYCDKSLICSKEECYCFPGFKGNYCQEECPDGSWGSSCKNICTNCTENNCNKYSGICSKCQAGFYGDTCADTMFNLTLITILASNISIKIEAANYNSNITVQYKKTSPSDFQYITCGVNTFCEIANLDSLSKYEICVFYQNECFKKISFKTKCVGLNAKNFKITPEKQNCTIKVIKKVTSENCPLKSYTLNINNTSMDLKQTQVIKSLTSFTNYSFKIKFMEDNIYLINRHYNEIILHVRTKASDFSNKRSYLNKRIIIDTTVIIDNGYLHSLWVLFLIPIIVTALFLWKTDRLSKFCRKRKQEIPEYMELPTINKLDLNNVKMNFGNSIKLTLKDDIISKLEEEFENITITRNFSCDIGNEAENKLKNRNNEIIPYDETLVKLKGIPGLEYINANYVKTPFGNKTIIATQCPQLNTFYDFWRMIWQENVSIIICLATSSEGKDNFFQYWPTNLEEMIMKGITIEHKNNEIYTGYVVKNFEIKINEELEKTVFKAASRNIKLFTFLSWPNDDIPINPLSYYYFLRHVEKCDKGSQPIVVHCSDGYGRTGTFIMTYNLIIKNDQESIDISELLSSLRTCRPNLITQANQYRFVYYITDEFINGINKTLNLTQLFIKVNKLNDTELESDLNYVNNRLYINKLLYSYKINNLISPDDCTNVVYVNGYEKENHFMSAQHPTISTIESFWTMVFTKEIQLVISLHEMKNENNLWAFDTEMITFDSLEMELINKDDKTSFIVYDIKLIDPRNKNSTTCKLIKFKDWKFNQIAPRNYQAFRELYNLYINEASALMDNSPVLLTCVDGYTGCGLFIAVDLVLNKIKYTKEFNINWAVQSIQISREEFMTNKEQFKFIYEFSLYYNNLESRENLCINPTYLVPLKKL